MSDFQLKTPVAFIIFNRPDTTKRVFAEIAKARPSKLLVIADGPRADYPDDAEKCTAVRNIIEEVDWDCEVLINYSDVNLGCKHRVSSGLDWVFDTVEEAIILEDDCLPHPTFFRFCEEMLNYYRFDTRILHIGGTNPITNDLMSNTYYYSKYNRIWGWATWRRAWKYFDPEIKLWKDVRKKRLHYQLFRPNEAKYWEKRWDDVYHNRVDTWDFQWFFCRLMQGKAIIPCTNLVSNIGFGEDATHTHSLGSSLANLKRGEITFPISHPLYVIEDIQRDNIWSKQILMKNGLKNLTIKIIRRILK